MLAFGAALRMHSNAERNCSLFHHLLSVCFTTCFLSVWQFDVEAIPCNASRKAVCVSLHINNSSKHTYMYIYIYIIYIYIFLKSLRISLGVAMHSESANCISPPPSPHPIQMELHAIEQERFRGHHADELLARVDHPLRWQTC